MAPFEAKAAAAIAMDFILGSIEVKMRWKMVIEIGGKRMYNVGKFIRYS